MLSNVSLTARTIVLAAIRMCTTREHGRTTRMLKIGRHNGAHAEVCEGPKNDEASKNRRVVKTTRASH